MRKSSIFELLQKYSAIIYHLKFKAEITQYIIVALITPQSRYDTFLPSFKSKVSFSSAQLRKNLDECGSAMN